VTEAGVAGTVALVTGASRGGGRGIAVRCDHTDDAQGRRAFRAHSP